MSATSKRGSFSRHIFLQDQKTKMLLGEDNQWTGDDTVARDFKYTLHAVCHALDNQLAGAQVLIRFRGTDLQDVIVPISYTPPAAP